MRFSDQLFYDLAQLMACVPGTLGVLLRRLFYKLTLEHCGQGLVVEWLSYCTTRRTCFGDHVWIGPSCIIGNAYVGSHSMIAGHTMILSQSDGHKGGTREVHTDKTIIGSGCWIGTHTTIKAHLASGTTVGAGAVVTRTYNQNQTLVGIPARPL